MSEPEPLTPPECDLRDFVFMPLDVHRLMTSETWMLGNGAECKAALSLWCASWHQIPAGSLPDNDRMLAVFSQAVLEWKKVRDHALRGWVKCSDGRLYHPVVAEKAQEAWQHKLRQRERGRAGAAKRWGGDGGNSGRGMPQASPPDSGGNSASNASAMPEAMLSDSKGQGQGQGQGQGKPLANARGVQGGLLPDPASEPAPRPEPEPKEFAEFWSRYPRKEGRREAAKAFRNAIKRSPAAEIVAGVKRFRWPAERQFIPHPATWLNQDRWRDETAGQASGPEWGSRAYAAG